MKEKIKKLEEILQKKYAELDDEDELQMYDDYEEMYKAYEKAYLVAYGVAMEAIKLLKETTG